MKSNALDFLSQSYSDIWNNFEYIRANHSVPKWDYVVITASNEKQAEMYRLQIKQRIDSGFLPSSSQYVCIPDPEGKRVGSGGATLETLRIIGKMCGESNIGKKKILLIHSGGNSKRVPQYSACGKLFAPVPRCLPNGNRSTLFDEFMIVLSSIPDRSPNGLLVLSGDVLLLFNPLQISLSSNGAMAISVKAPAEMGSHHGVFLSDKEGNVHEFLHKKSVLELNQKGAVNNQDNVDIDTGMIWFCGEMVSRLFILANEEESYSRFVNEKACLSFYGDFLYPLASDISATEYFEQSAENVINEELLSCRKELWPLLHQYRLSVAKLSPAKFLHFGTTEELRVLMNDGIEEYQSFGWSRQVLSNNAGKTYCAVNSYIGKETLVGEGSYLEDAFIPSSCTIGKNCIVSNVNLESQELMLPDETVLHVLPLSKGTFCARIYGIKDNPKEPIWFGKPLHLLLEAWGVPSNVVFHNNEDTFWDARLFPVCQSVQEALEWVTRILSAHERGGFSEQELTEYVLLPKESLASSFNNTDSERLISWQQHLEDQIRSVRFCESIVRNESFDSGFSLLGKGPALVRQLSRCLKISETEDFSIRLRVLKAISVLLPDGMCLEGKDRNYFADVCFKELSDVVQDFQHLSVNQTLSNTKIFDKEVEICLPVRVNWGGGWSDTPPYCFDYGGTVLNAAITVNGRYPIRATAEITTKKRIIHLESIDQQISKDFMQLEELLDYSNPKDPFALHKASLCVCGFISPSYGTFEQQLERLGGGISMQTHVEIPKGSGLGASSILAGACAKALNMVIGNNLSDEQLCYQTLCIEQLMSTGGGWQDQVGGLVPYIKLIQTKPGLAQRFNIHRLMISPEIVKELNERFVLVYTGQRRLARNILREVVGKVLLRDPQTIEVLDEIQKLAVLMAFELERGHISEFARLLSKHWQLSVILDPGTTNTCIEYIFKCCEDLIEGKFISGAGGGGFLMMILKPGCTKSMLSSRLEEMFQDSGVAVWDSEILG